LTHSFSTQPHHLKGNIMNQHNHHPEATRTTLATPLKALALAALIGLASAAAQAQTVSVSPAATTVTVGTSFNLDLLATGFPNKIFGGAYNLSYDASILQLDDIVFPPSWEFAVDKGTPGPAGTVSDIYFNTFAAPRSGDFLTSTLQFTAIGAGTSAITLTPSPSFPFGDEFLNEVSVTFVPGSVTVTAVPEPSSLMLMLAGIGVAAVVASRRRQA
jgi:hypothetical protein